MEAFDEGLMVRAATIDEVLSDAFVVLPGEKADSDLAARRLGAWCRSCGSGDWELFARRLERDGKLVMETENTEYPAIYQRFHQLITTGQSQMDAQPLALVADAFLVALRETV